MVAAKKTPDTLAALEGRDVPAWVRRATQHNQGGVPEWEDTPAGHAAIAAELDRGRRRAANDRRRWWDVEIRVRDLDPDDEPCPVFVGMTPHQWIEAQRGLVARRGALSTADTMRAGGLRKLWRKEGW